MLPLIWNLSGRRALVVGGGSVAARKVLRLLEAGAVVDVLAVAIEQALWDRQRRLPARMRCVEEAYTPRDLSDYALVVAATNDAAINRQVADDADAASAPVAVADDPERSSVHFPAEIRRGPLVLSLSTCGRSPALAARLRQEFDEELPGWLGDYVEALGRVRRTVLEHVPDGPERRAALIELAGKDVFDRLVPASVEVLEARLREQLPSGMLPDHACWPKETP